MTLAIIIRISFQRLAVTVLGHCDVVRASGGTSKSNPTFALKIPLRDVASMQCRQPSLEGTGEVPLRRLVKEALRMRPSRIIFGEVRQAESLHLLIALNSGVPGMRAGGLGSLQG